MNSQNIPHDWVWARLARRQLRIAWKNVVGQALRLPNRVVSNSHISVRQARRLPYNRFES
jgi:hypothetical protein